MNRKCSETVGTLALSIMLLLGLNAAPARAQAVAIITDISGKVTMHGTAQAPSILAEIRSGMRVRVERASRLVVLYLKSGDEYGFSGPAEVEFHDTMPAVVSGAPPQRRAHALARKVSIKPGGVAQAAFVMRSARTTPRIRLLNLSGTKTLETRPEFRWQQFDGAKSYRFELLDGTGKVLIEREGEGVTYRLPADIRLEEEMTYTWEISVRLPDGRRYVSAGDFSLAAAAVRQRVESLRPAPDANVSDRVSFAAWLQQSGFKDEAQKFWRALATERPQDATLKALTATN